jgi:hypothetical protein
MFFEACVPLSNVIRLAWSKGNVKRASELTLRLTEAHLSTSAWSGMPREPDGKINSNDADKVALPMSFVQIGDKNQFFKSAGLASPVLVDVTWDLVEERAQGFGCAKLPITTNSRSPLDNSLHDMKKGLAKGRYLTHAQIGGDLSDQLLVLERAVEVANIKPLDADPCHEAAS